MTENREPIKTSSPIYNCICDWMLMDTGVHALPQRTREHPECPVHSKAGKDPGKKT